MMRRTALTIMILVSCGVDKSDVIADVAPRGRGGALVVPAKTATIFNMAVVVAVCMLSP